MTERTFGPYTARIIGPRATITGPHGVQITAGAETLRNMLGRSRIGWRQREAMVWAVKQLEGQG